LSLMVFFFCRYAYHLDPPSFPTRRSSDLALLKLVSGDIDDERLTTLGGILCDAQSSSLFGLRTTLRSLAGGQPGAESSVGKLIGDRKSTRLNSSHVKISYAVFCLKKKKKI